MLIHQHLSHLAIAAGMLVLLAMAWWPTRCRPPRRRRASMSSRCWWSIRACTAPIRRADVDEAGTYAVTGSHDKTVRVWSLHRRTS